MIGPYKLNEIYTGDARELARAIPDESIDMIFTDPPYLKEFLPLYYWLVEFSARVLKSDGFVLFYVGGYWKDEIMDRSREHLEYFWDYTSWEKGDSPIIWPRRTITRCKSILAYRKKGSGGMPRTNVLGMWVASEQDKRFHAWGQAESTARYYIDCFTARGDIVLDPFAGGGTTPAMCKALDRSYLAFEIEPRQSDIARARVASQQMPLVGFWNNPQLWEDAK